MINIDTRLGSILDESELYLLFHITKRLGKKMFAFPSNKTLLKDTKWGIEKLQNVKERLIKKDIIEVEVVIGRSNIYHVKTDKIGVFVGADKLSDTPPENQIGVYLKTNPPTPPENQITKYYPNEVLTSKNGTLTSFQEKEKKFYKSLADFVPKYGKAMVRSFYEHWSEWNDTKTLMKWEIKKKKEGTFDLAKRLATWKSREIKKPGETPQVYTNPKPFGE